MSEVLGQWAEGYSCALFGNKAGLSTSMPPHQFFVGMLHCSNA